MKMNMAQKVLLIIGGAFAGIGAVLTMIFGSIGMVFRPMRAFLALPLFFLILGICFIAAVLFGQQRPRISISYLQISFRILETDWRTAPWLVSLADITVIR